MNKKKVLITIDKNVHQIAKKKSVKEFGEKNFSGYVSALIERDNNIVDIHNDIVVIEGENYDTVKHIKS